MLAVGTLVTPLHGLATLKTGSNRDTYDRVPACDAGLVVQTPTSSSDPASERIDPVVLLSRPVEGFHHPRKHLFTDRLLGRFYEDSSLDAETRKTSKCLAGRLGTASSNPTTRPNTTATTTSRLRSSRSTTPTTRRGGRRMNGSASALALGSSSRVVVGLAARKEQVQKEIQEQKALIEKLEGRVASLSGRGGRGPATRGSTAPSDDDRHNGDAARRRHGTEGRPTAAPRVDGSSIEGRTDVDWVGDEHWPAVQNQSTAEGRGKGDRHLSGSDSGMERSRSQSGNKSHDLHGHEPNARRDSLRFSSDGTGQAPSLSEEQEGGHSTTIQNNLRGIGRREEFSKLQSAKEDFEHHMQALVSAAAVALQQQQQQQQQQQAKLGALSDGRSGTVKSSSEAGARSEVEFQSVVAAATRLLEAGRREGLVEPPFETLRALYSGINNLAGDLASLSSKDGAEDREGREGFGLGVSCELGGPSSVAGMVESCGAAKEALDAIRADVGADITICGRKATSPGPSVASRHKLSSPAGSGRAAVVAMASGRGGLLVPPDESPTSGRQPFAEQPRGDNNGARIERGRTDLEETCHSRGVPLSTLDAKSIAQLLLTNNFDAYAPGFVAQGVDGVMLSDPNLCEADFAELGLGGGEYEGARDTRARLVSFFRECQHSGVVLPLIPGLPRPYEEPGQRHRDLRADDFALDEPRGRDSSTGRTRPTAYVEPYWQGGSALVDRGNQRVIPQTSLEPSETDAAGSAMSPPSGTGGSRRVSVKLNQGVVVTVGGREAGVVDNAEVLPETNDEDKDDAKAAAAEVATGGRTLSAAITGGSGGRGGGGGSLAPDGRGRRTSLGLRGVSLYKESRGAGEGVTFGGADAISLPPSVDISISNATIDVFR